MVDLQIKKATLDAKLAKQAYERGDDVEDGQGHTVDRTQLLQEIQDEIHTKRNKYTHNKGTLE